ncbi:Universal stress protein [Rubripirellula tenax]|uniref:Universal stress protein n=1 Tax=Rubripirellula tenax TaxID=2528015 RepID=A0A5C6EDQ3_9BACT|nr:universal stress protein [Rubripirellula tenax]TWU46127.1 Universal stress protein [Rubripirellula tenax]
MKILLPIDGSDAANEAVEFVRSLAMENSVDVTILIAYYKPTEYSFQPWVPEWTEQEKVRTGSILAKAKQVLDANCDKVTIAQETGAVVPCILGRAKKDKVDLIVLGAKGHSAIHRVLLGSVSDSIATRAECSVVVVRPTKNETHQPRKIVLGYDKSIASREAAAELMEWKLNRETSVDVVSVVQNPYIYVGEGYIPAPVTLQPELITSVKETAERMASQISEMFPHTDAHIPVADHIGEAIVHAAEGKNADLVIVGDTGHSLLGELILGSTSNYVLRHAPCSVWISRHHYKSDETEQKSGNAVAAS